jgi:PAS domain S-box-containing protein
MGKPGETTSSAQNYPFLAGGGEMGALTRAKDWSKTPAGPVSQWPQSLQTTLGILLKCKFPMFLWWGPGLVCFYNDAYRPSLGQDGKHPSILGMPAAEAWPEIWHVIKPLIDQVLAGEEAVWFEDMLVPIYRNGKVEDVYWTFSYSPVNDESGKIAGVLVTCNETTDKVITKRRIEESERNLRSIILQAPVAIAIFRGPDYIVEIANAAALELWGRKEKEVMNKPILGVMSELESQGIKGLLDHVYQTGEHFEAAEFPVQLFRGGKLDNVYINFVYQPLYDNNGTINGIITIGFEVSQHVIARKEIEESEEKLNIVILASELGTWELNLKTDEVTLSDRYLQIFGYKEHADIPHSVFVKHLHPDDSITRGNAFAEALKTSVLGYEARIIWNDGSVHWIEAKGKVFYDDARQPLKLLGTVRDITDEKNNQQELEESEEKFRLLADSLPQFVWTADEKGSLHYFNKAVFDYSGLSAEECANGGWLQIVHPDDRDENIKRWNNSIATGKDFLFEHRFRRYDGEYRWQLSRAVAQKDVNGNIQMWVGSSTDIQQIKEQEQLKDYFISVASHELKTPITSIKGYVQLLKRNYGSSEDTFLKNSLSVIDKQIVTLTTLISDLLDLSKIKTGVLFLKKAPFAINELVQETIDEIIHINPGCSISFSKEAGTVVDADRDRIGQVLINLLTNAVKYSPNSRLVKVTSVVQGDNVTVSVEDSGIGISKANQERIFERFFRVEGSNENMFSGFGIGLFIASEIIQRHGGEIGVKSEPGKGSTFYFSLPGSAEFLPQN